MYIIDSGPALTFFATNRTRWFFAATAGPIHAPDAVRDEVVVRVPRRKPAFAKAPAEWKKAEGRFIHRLSDVPTDELRRAARDVFAQDLARIQSRSKDLGESMALIHASLRVEAGDDVIILCDDGGAQQLIGREAARLGRIGALGSLHVADTVDLLCWAIERGAVTSRAELRKAYSAMAALNDSLPRDIEATRLLKSPPWPA